MLKGNGMIDVPFLLTGNLRGNDLMPAALLIDTTVLKNVVSI